MTLPSISHQPSPARSMPPPPSGRNLRPKAPKRKRGGQPGNRNARKLGTFSTFHPGPFSPTRFLIKELQVRLRDPASSVVQIVDQARTAKQELPLPAPALVDKFAQVLRLYLKLSDIISGAWVRCTPSFRLSDALESIAHDPFGWFERGYRDCQISRDADSFFIVSEKSAQNSPLPPASRGGFKPPSAASAPGGAEGFATNLTDGQWAVLAPLIPPDPRQDFLTGEPPIIIAANRLGFTQYYSTSEFNDFVIMKNYHTILKPFPAVCSGLPSPNPHVSPNGKEGTLGRVSPLPSPNPEDLGKGRGRGRPRTSPRLLLDAIIWKLATGQNWDALPFGFPPMRVCRKYYRRLFLSGRLYTLLLALYNHMRLEASTDLPSLLEAGVFTTTPGQKIALSPDTSPTWENYTALLFMQLARSAYTRLHRQHKKAHPISLPLLPVFKGIAALSTGIIPSFKPPEPELTFQPLENSLVWKKWRKIERDQKTIAREVAKRLRSTNSPGLADLSAVSDEEA